MLSFLISKIQNISTGKEVNHAKAYGRTAFSCPKDQQPALSDKIEKAGQKILTPLLTLDTPGKETVRVIILADPVSVKFAFRNIVEISNSSSKFM
jgi:hypothetical protein